ncbi:C40 family peptidase [Flaviaesturariibacter amylovorans]|uniref:NlpC/P60 domain-containing protein n=1 Tax=Flaviaesturariibacter amylovorans TaxID=1084520 RepID=A0ABP8GIB4_9BACT
MTRHIILLALLATTGIAAAAQGGPRSASAAKEVKFLEDIEVGFGTTTASNAGSTKAAPAAQTAAPRTATTPTTASSPTYAYSSTVASRTGKPAIPPVRTVDIEAAGTLHLKYALLLNTEVETVPALNLLVLMDDWWGTRYRLGGNDRSGIDCSGFTCLLFNSLYGKQLPRTAREQFQYLPAVDPNELKEGDLVFFANGGTVSHVGFYLQNNKFVHASTSEGVTISDLNDRYWQARFAGAGRYEPGAPANTGTSRP